MDKKRYYIHNGVNRFITRQYYPETKSKVAYASSEEETFNLPDGTQNKFAFRLFIPEDQPAGTYTSKVMFTMTE